MAGKRTTARRNAASSSADRVMSATPVSKRLRHATALLIAAALIAIVTGCGSTQKGAATHINWYINPDNGGQAEIARRCTEQARGRYRISVSLLPRSASDQREQLLRRLAAKDSSIDLMSLDPVFVAEFAQAGFLAPIPRDEAPGLTKGDVGPAVRGATWKGRLVTVPMWANTQVLWYRKSVVRKAGLDLTHTPVTWAQIIRAARTTGATVAVQARRYEGYTVLINALVESAGGHIIRNPGASAKHTRLGLKSPAGEDAAGVIRQIGSNGVGGPSLSSEDEEASRALFEGSDGGFMVNWPYVWPAEQGAVKDGEISAATLADIGWAQYPRVESGRASRPPYGGIDLGIGGYSHHPRLALEASRCITSTPNQAYYFVHDGNPAARASVFADASIVKAFPMAPLLRESLEASAPRPQSDAYGDLSDALQESFHPPAAVNSKTPAKASSFILAVLEGKKLV
jgi:multiple sugar transport system substrate-binding protein